MKISVQTDDFRLIEEAIDSNCSGVRFGSEFCEYKMPSLDVLESAYEIIHGAEKEFTYVTPRLSNSGVEKVKKQLTILNEKNDVNIVFNDLGALNILRHYQKLHPHLGRQLIRVPARSPWVEVIKNTGLLENRQFEEAFFSTSLNYPLTVELFRTYGVRNVDVDWLSSACFDFLMNHGLKLSVHLHLVPITFARRCHTARFVGEKSPEECSKPCFEDVFLLKLPKKEVVPGLFLDDMLPLPELFLHGNVVFEFTQPLPEDIKKLRENNVAEVVLEMSPITRVDNRQKIDDFILSLKDAS